MLGILPLGYWDWKFFFSAFSKFYLMYTKSKNETTAAPGNISGIGGFSTCPWGYLCLLSCICSPSPALWEKIFSMSHLTPDAKWLLPSKGTAI